MTTGLYSLITRIDLRNALLRNRKKTILRDSLNGSRRTTSRVSGMMVHLMPTTCTQRSLASLRQRDLVVRLISRLSARKTCSRPRVRGSWEHPGRSELNRPLLCHLLHLTGILGNSCPPLGKQLQSHLCGKHFVSPACRVLSGPLPVTRLSATLGSHQQNPNVTMDSQLHIYHRHRTTWALPCARSRRPRPTPHDPAMISFLLQDLV
ncbi:hypothetical protein EDB85DRAFT_1066151 [Lactarius pseudohatsudake]|nr:hypothetical protein EDB85DRAFT_1066151 [Lactarius pseudohatsudake]